MLISLATHSYGSEQSFSTFHGTWKTEPYLSQMGRVITGFTFENNDECTVTIKLLDTTLDEMKEKGICEFKEDKLIIRNRNGVFVNTYTLFNNILTITEKNGDTYKLQREL